MKIYIFCNQFAIITLMSILLIGCNNSEKHWTDAKLANSKAKYQEFIKKHSSSGFVESAQKAIDSLDMVTNLKTHNVDSLLLYLKNHTSSKFLQASNHALDSIEWNIAFYSRDTARLYEYILKYPGSENKQKAEDIIWEKKWPPVKIEKANSVLIRTKDGGSGYGEQMFYSGRDGVARFTGGKAPEVDIWREFSESDQEYAKKLGLRPGIAYLYEYPNKYKFIKKVDLTKTDKQLCAEFGVSSN